MKKEIKIEDYEIGDQKNFDLLSFYYSLPDEKEDDIPEKVSDSDLEDYHHSLFYPILKYSINILNTKDDNYLSENRNKIGIDENNKIYISVGRQMYDLFFTESEALIDDTEIKFDKGKNNFSLNSVHDLKSNTIIETYKQYFDIPLDETEKETKKQLKLKASNLQIDAIQLMESKKKNIVSKFLKGYSHQEGVLKSFEAKIPGQFVYMPNLIFKTKNLEGKTIEELDQIYLLKLEEEKKVINGFDYFFYANSKTKKRRIEVNGKPLVLNNDNLYFIEVKKSSLGLNLSYDKVAKNPPAKHNSRSTKYKREDLTDVGNAILSVEIFSNLIENLLKTNKPKNLLYIVDDDFNVEMGINFNKCLLHDMVVFEDVLDLNIYLIYTQPDLALKHFIEETNKKNTRINYLEKTLEKRELEFGKNSLSLKAIAKQLEFNCDYLRQKYNYSSSYIDVEPEVLEFCKEIKNKKKLMSIGLMNSINENHKYTFSSLVSVRSFREEELKNDYFLIDFNTFNYVAINDIEKEFIIEISIKTYKDKLSMCLIFDEAYILVDFVFMLNFSKIIEENDLYNYAISIYMFENYFFMIYFKRDRSLISPEIKLFKNKCMNPMLDEKEIDLKPGNVEEFAELYYNLLLKREFFEKKVKDIKFGITYLFDFKSKINYLLYLCNKPEEINEKKNNNNNLDCFVQIMSVKNKFNILYDDLPKDFIENFKYKQIIFLRKTEFGKIIEQKNIESIINYLFKIKNFKIENKIYEEEKTNINEKHRLVSIIKDNHRLSFYSLDNLEIEPKIITLIEYNYFLAMPLLLKKKENKPKVLILSNDFGLLNYYFTKLYKDKLQISSFMETKENANDERFKINNDNIGINNFENVIEEAIKKNNSNINNYDLILIEPFEKRNKEDDTIPNYELIFKLIKILNFDGILAFNLRTETFHKYNDTIEKLKKKYKKVLNIYLRPCSAFIICSHYQELKLERIYEGDNEINFDWVINKIKQEINPKKK